MPRSPDRDVKGAGAEAERRLRIAVTLGDPRGVGPEVAIRAIWEPTPIDADILLVGPEGAVDTEGVVVDTEGVELVATGRWQEGADEKAAGAASVAAIERAVALAVEGSVDAICTAPISKYAVAAAGFKWPGHTEMLADMTGTPKTVLCMAVDKTPRGSPLRVMLVTNHVPLRQVPEIYTVDLLCTTGRISHDGLRRWWGIEQPSLAVCAFNPHASEHGIFGDEEARVCEPAIAQLNAEGIDARGPIPADTVFHRAMRGEFDAVLAPYHDIGMTAIKTAAFGGAVNVTLGLPFPRTSPDHGTAFDIARSGRADASSMRSALEAAVHFARGALTSSSGPDRLRSG